MNIYLIQEDGEASCWQAETPVAAIEAVVRKFEVEMQEEGWRMEESPKDYWYRACFQSCALVGELANPTEESK